MRNISLEVLEVFAEAQSVARAITDEKTGNARTAYLQMKQADNAEQWTKTRSNKAKLASRNKRRKETYDPAKRKAVGAVEWAAIKADPKRLAERNAKRRIQDAKRRASRCT